MKKYLNLSWCLLLVLGFSSCDTDDDGMRDEPTDIGGYAYPSQRSITFFDVNEDLNINFFTAEGVTAQTVEILEDGTVIGTGTVSGETGSFNTSILGDLEPGSYPLRIRTTYSNGNVSEDPFTVSVGHPVNLGEDNPMEVTMDELSSVELEYEVSTFGAAIDEVLLMLKKNDAGTYMDSGVTLEESGTVELSETNYQDLNLAVNDTLYYKFTAESGSLMDEAESYIVIIE
ncbi:MAG: hypothetical protein WBL21_13740 [Salinimicrobium sp.]